MKDTTIIKTEGFGPFVTKLIFRDLSGIIQTWESRLHRKGLETTFLNDFKSVRKAFWNGFKKVATLNWWISIVFTVGSFLFILGSVLSLWTPLAVYFKLSTTQVNFVFFLGSIPFTTAAFLQLLQAYLANKKLSKSTDFQTKHKGLNLWSLGFLSAFLQFIGTLLFNVNTFNGTKSNLNVLESNIEIWIPDFFGSILFLVSGYLAVIEVSHCYWKWETKNLSWWIVFINFLGCIAFMISAFLAFVPKGGSSNFVIEMSLVFTLIGAFCFFMGALLMLPEMGGDKN